MAIEDPAWPRADRWLASESSDPEVVVVGFPTSVASLSPSRADLAPARVRDALARFSTFHSEWDLDLAGLPVLDAGDLPVDDLTPGDLVEEAPSMIDELPEAAIRLFLGGDNAITRPIVRASGVTTTGLLTIDAHHDVRSLDRGPTNGTPVRGLIDDGLPGDRIVQIGIHTFANSKEYRRFCDEAGVLVRTMSDVETAGVEWVVDEALGHLGARCDRIHVDVDMDVLDRTFAPGCPGARPGGMDPRTLFAAVRRCATDRRVVSLDFVEVDPERDPDGRTIDAMAGAMLSAAAGYAERRAEWTRS